VVCATDVPLARSNTADTTRQAMRLHDAMLITTF